RAWVNPGCLRTVSRSDVRISQLVNRIFAPENAGSLAPADRKEQIDSALKYLYFVHGYRFQAPSFPIPHEGGRITSEGIADYLQLAAQLQSRQAGAIYRLITARPHSAMCTVHAFGGHLGGANIPGALDLANRGGPLSQRNVDCDGRIHDID